jgi:drug/metabolite transporter (DMT)-like permease
MNWFLFAIAGYFLIAVVGVLDKFLLGQRPVTKPAVYTFYVGLLSIFVFVLAPFGLAWPGWIQFLIALGAGAFMLLGLLYLFHALDIGSASRVLPAFGGLTPILVLALSFIFLGERLNLAQIAAFLLLVLGGMLISFKKEPKERQGKRFRFIIFAIFLTAISLVLTKYVFIYQGFISGFVWSRLGSSLTALTFLIIPQLRRSIFSGAKQATGGLSLLFVSNKAVAGLGTVAVNYAISLASVSLVNAMQGIQYAFLLVLTIFLSKKFPRIIQEKITPGILLQKILAIILIAAGLAILAF